MYLNAGVFNVDAESLTRDMCKQQELEKFITEANKQLVAQGKNTICVLSKNGFKKGWVIYLWHTLWEKIYQQHLVS